MEMRGPLDQPTDRNTVVFKIDFECTRNNKAPRGSTYPNELYVNSELKSSDIRWEPAACSRMFLQRIHPRLQIRISSWSNCGLVSRWKWKCTLSRARNLVLIILLIIIIFRIFVATAWYRFLPHIKITKPIPPHFTEKF